MEAQKKIHAPEKDVDCDNRQPLLRNQLHFNAPNGALTRYGSPCAVREGESKAASAGIGI
jgi:hypothetical protein